MEKKKRVLPEALKKWQSHLKKVREANPQLSLKDAMREAKKSYIK